MTAEDRPVRERLAEIIERSDNEPYVEPEDVYLLNADAILADTDLLDDLCRERLEQVGWYCRTPFGDDDYGTHRHKRSRGSEWVGKSLSFEPTCQKGVPVYHFRGRTDG